MRLPCLSIVFLSLYVCGSTAEEDSSETGAVEGVVVGVVVSEAVSTVDEDDNDGCCCCCSPETADSASPELASAVWNRRKKKTRNVVT